jgi:hypothetical protein
VAITAILAADGHCALKPRCAHWRKTIRHCTMKAGARQVALTADQFSTPTAPATDNGSDGYSPARGRQLCLGACRANHSAISREFARAVADRVPFHAELACAEKLILRDASTT